MFDFFLNPPPWLIFPSFLVGVLLVLWDIRRSKVVPPDPIDVAYPTTQANETTTAPPSATIEKQTPRPLTPTQIDLRCEALRNVYHFLESLEKRLANIKRGDDLVAEVKAHGLERFIGYVDSEIQKAQNDISKVWSEQQIRFPHIGREIPIYQGYRIRMIAGSDYRELQPLPIEAQIERVRLHPIFRHWREQRDNFFTWISKTKSTILDKLLELES